MELVLAILARHAGQAPVCWMEHTIANIAFLYAVDLFIDVAFPEEDGRDDVTIADLQEVSNGEHPFVLLAFCDSELLAHLNLDGL